MTIVQIYRCESCGFELGPIGFGPVVNEREVRVVFCATCQTGGRSTVRRGSDEAHRCPVCSATAVVDVDSKCPRCGSTQVDWKMVLP